MEEKKYVIVDIDGTLMNNEHRKHFLDETPKNWKGFFGAINDDIPNYDIVKLVAILSNYFTIVFCTGRADKYREITKKQITFCFLKMKDIYNVNNFGKLLMRPDNIKMKDYKLKTSIILNHPTITFENIAYVLEDRNSVVEMWRKHAVRCLQVQPGNF